MELKLTIDTVPEKTWGINVRRSMPRASWEKIRKRAFRIHGRKCSVCGYAGRSIEVHEVWEYDLERRIQRLVDFIPLCKLCHLVKHFWMALQLSRRGQLDIVKVVRHFIEVNRCTREDFREHRREAQRMVELKHPGPWRIEIKGQVMERPPGFEQLPLIPRGSSSGSKRGSMSSSRFPNPPGILGRRPALEKKGK